MAQLKDLIVNGIARVVGTLFASTINEGGTNLADKYLGKTAQASDSAKLGGTDASSYATQSWVTGKGYTTNSGTVTSVVVKMNGAVKGTITTSGTIDLGTVITSHQDISGKQDKITTSNKLAYSLISGTPTSLPANGGTSTYASYIGDSDNNYDFNDISGIGQVCDNHIANTNNPHSVTKAQVGLGNVGNFKAVSTVASQGLTATEKSNARANIGAGTSSLTIGTTSTTAAAGNHSHSVATTYSNGYMSASDKSKLDGIGAVSIADIDSLFDGGGGGSGGSGGSGGGSGYYYSSSSSSWW